MDFSVTRQVNVYESKYLKVIYYEGFSLVEMIWKVETKWMNEMEYKDEFMRFVSLIKDLKSTKGIINTKNLYFPIIPELQDWTNQVIFPILLSLGADKVAFLVSNILIIQMGIEQTMEEEEGAKFEVQYFDNYQKAMLWILSI